MADHDLHQHNNDKHFYIISFFSYQDYPFENVCGKMTMILSRILCVNTGSVVLLAIIVTTDRSNDLEPAATWRNVAHDSFITSLGIQRWQRANQVAFGCTIMYQILKITGIWLFFPQNIVNIHDWCFQLYYSVAAIVLHAISFKSVDDANTYHKNGVLELSNENNSHRNNYYHTNETEPLIWMCSASIIEVIS